MGGEPIERTIYDEIDAARHHHARIGGVESTALITPSGGIMEIRPLYREARALPPPGRVVEQYIRWRYEPLEHERTDYDRRMRWIDDVTARCGHDRSAES